MSRRLLIKSSGSNDLPSKIIFKVLNDTTTLQYNIAGTNVTLKDKNGNILTSVASGYLSNIAVDPTTSDDVYTIEAEKLTICNFQYAPRLDKILEFTVPNKKTDISSCFNNCNTLTEVRNITVTEATNLSYFFGNCSNLTIVDPFYVKAGVNATYLFLNTRITSNPIINIEDIGDASGLFLSSSITDLSSIQNKDLKWTNMSGFLNETPVTVIENFRFINIVYLSFSSNNTVVTIRNIQAPQATGASFNSSSSLKEVTNISIPNATTLYSLFYNCVALETVSDITTGLIRDISNGFSNCFSLVVAPQLTYDLNNIQFPALFEGCISLTDASYYFNLINNFTGDTKLNCQNMFKGCKLLNVDLSTIQFSNIRDASSMFADTAITQAINLTIPCEVINFMFSECKVLTTVQNVNFTNAIAANSVFSTCPLLTTASTSVNSTIPNLLSCSSFYGNCQNLTTASFTCSSAANIIYMDAFFTNCLKLESFNLSIPNDQVLYMYQSFFNCTSLVDISNINWSKLANSYGMFRGCTGLVSAGNFDLSLSEDCAFMFYNCSSLQSIGDVTMSIATSATDVFNGCINLETVGDVTIPNVENASNLFYGCSKLTTTGTLSFGKATTLNNLFTNCSLINTVGNITAPKCTSFRGVFSNCAALTSISLSLPKVVDYSICFSGCSELLTVTIGDTDSTVTQINTNSMFSNCSKVTTVTMDLTKVFNPQNMFLNCIALNMALNNITINGIGNAYKMFSNSGITSITNLTIVVGNSWQPSLEQMFSVCTNLTSVNGLTISTDSNTSLFAFFSGSTNLTAISNVSLTGPFGTRFFFDNIGITDLDITLAGLTSTSDCEYIVNNCSALTNITKLEVGGFANTLVNMCSNLLTVDTLKINSSYSNDRSYVITSCDSLTSINEITSNSDKEIILRGGTSLATVNKITIPNCPSIALEVPSITTVTEIVSSSLVSLSNFATNTKLSSYPIINTSNVTNYQYSFSNTKVTSYNNNYDLSKAIQLIATFTGCTELTTVVISDVFTASQVYSNGLFSGCPNLTSVTITNASKLRDIRNMFSGSNNITDLVLTGFTSGFEVPIGITDVAKLEALIESAGTNEVPSEPYIRVGDQRLATISTTVKNNATAKGWILT